MTNIKNYLLGGLLKEAAPTGGAPVRPPVSPATPAVRTQATPTARTPVQGQQRATTPGATNRGTGTPRSGWVLYNMSNGRRLNTGGKINPSPGQVPTGPTPPPVNAPQPAVAPTAGQPQARRITTDDLLNWYRQSLKQTSEPQPYVEPATTVQYDTPTEATALSDNMRAYGMEPRSWGMQAIGFPRFNET